MTPPKAVMKPINDFLADHIKEEIQRMIDLGIDRKQNLIPKIFPDGWENAELVKLKNLYELCRRSEAKFDREGWPE